MLSTKRARRANKSGCSKRQHVAERAPTNAGSRSETSGSTSGVSILFSIHFLYYIFQYCSVDA